MARAPADSPPRNRYRAILRMLDIEIPPLARADVVIE
jgi:hypothetical protein